MLTYIKQWLLLSQFNKKCADNLIKAYSEKHTNSLFKQELVFYKNMINTFDLQNVSKHYSFFLAINRVVTEYFNELNESHKQNRDLLILKNLFKEKLSLDFLYLLWTFEIFLFFSSNASNYVSDSHPNLNYPSQSVKTFSVIESLHSIANEILCKTSLLWGLEQLSGLYESDVQIKKALHNILHKLSELYKGSQFTIYTKEVCEVTSAADFSHTKFSDVFTEESSDEERTDSVEVGRKITIIAIDFEFDINPTKVFNILTSPAKIINKNSNFWVVDTIYANCSNFITQPFNRDPTIITKEFVEKISPTLDTGFYIDYIMVKNVNTLVNLELDKISKNIDKIINNIEEGGLLKNKTIRGVNPQSLALLLISIKKQKEFIRLSKEERIVNLIKNQDERLKEFKTIGDFIKSQLATEQELQRWISLIKLDKELANLLSEVQHNISHIQIYYKFKLLYSFLNQEGLTVIYFPVYIDFRGRLYYNSTISLQSFWCYRFIYNYGKSTEFELSQPNYIFTEDTITLYNEVFYKFGLKNSNYFEIYQSIGYLFKKEITKPDGGIKLYDILTLGIKKYLQHKDNDINEVWLLENTDTKLVVELFYYVNSINQIQLGNYCHFYVIKDTTCSMAQHAGKILGYNPNNLDKLNLSNQETGYDTYQIFINELKRVLLAEDSKLWIDVLGLLTRGFLKNLIMTSEYGVSIVTAREEFIKTVNEFSKRDKKYLIFKESDKYFNQIYSTLKRGELDLCFYLTKKETWINWILSSKVENVSFSDITIPVNYYYPVTQTLYYEKKSNITKRARNSVNIHFNISCNFELYKNIKAQKKHRNKKLINKKKIRSAVYVNQVHSLDALYLRELTYLCKLQKVYISTIHDGFAVTFVRGSWILSAANNSFFKNSKCSVNYYSKSSTTPPTINSNSILL